MSIVIYHNPRCSKSRQTLELLRSQGHEPVVIEYLKTPPSEQQLEQILDALGMEPRALLRTGEKAYRENGLDHAGLDGSVLISAMIADPVLIERPIVLANGKAAIGRPPERVLDIL